MTSTPPEASTDLILDDAATTLPPHIRRIVLTGFMGAGKTTVGRLLAQRLRWTFLDLDDHLVSRTGSSIPQLFAERGEAAFRRLESTALASALALPTTVLALGGGTPEALTNRLLLEQTPGTFVVFLDAPFPTLFDRCMLQNFGDPAVSRPVLEDPGAAQLRFAARHPLYTRLARLTLDTSSHPPAELAAAILHSLSAVR